MKTRIIYALYTIAAALAVFYPLISEAGWSNNHNETLVRDSQ